MLCRRLARELEKVLVICHVGRDAVLDELRERLARLGGRMSRLDSLSDTGAAFCSVVETFPLGLMGEIVSG